MVPLSLGNLAAYSAQVLCVAGAAGALLSLLRVDAPHVRYFLLRITLAICLVLPWLQPARPSVATETGAVTAEVGASREAAAVADARRAIDWPTTISVILAGGIAVRLAWLAIGLVRLSRLRRAGRPADASHHRDLQAAMGTAADVRYVHRFAQPVTFGFRRPVVLLPETLRLQPPEIREAVLAHELLHVQRGDWAWVAVEEVARAAFWFHPAMWWLISRIQLAREEVVDALAVARTGRRRAYLEALMAFAGEPPLSTAPAFARKRHLFRRMVLISKEDVMSARRLVVSTAVIVMAMATGGWFAVGAFPIVDSSAGQILQQTPGPLESSANPITPENPTPRRVEHEAAKYPPEAAAANARVSITLRLTVDASGSVAEARILSARLRLGDSATSLNDERAKPAYDAAVAAAIAAVEQWRYDAPAKAPISFDTTFFFSPDGAVTDTSAGVAAPPPPLPPPGTRALDGKGMRIGSGLRPPTKVKDVRPVYPPDAMDAKIQGVVIMDIRIDEGGRVTDAEVLRSIPALDQAAIDAVRQWEFMPTLLNGVPTPVLVTVTVQFTLK